MQQEMITVATYSRPWQAQIAKNFLEAAGIRVFLANEHCAIEASGIMVDTLLQVAAIDAVRAKELISTIPN